LFLLAQQIFITSSFIRPSFQEQAGDSPHKTGVIPASVKKAVRLFIIA
jgi:hypothetical protein